MKRLPSCSRWKAKIGASRSASGVKLPIDSAGSALRSAIRAVVPVQQRAGVGLRAATLCVFQFVTFGRKGLSAIVKPASRSALQLIGPRSDGSSPHDFGDAEPDLLAVVDEGRAGQCQQRGGGQPVALLVAVELAHQPRAGKVVVVGQDRGHARHRQLAQRVQQVGAQPADLTLPIRCLCSPKAKALPQESAAAKSAGSLAPRTPVLVAIAAPAGPGSA